MNNEQLKAVVKDKYSTIAEQSKHINETSCCGSTGCCSDTDYSIFSESYDTLKGYNPDADLGLGCGIPTEFALIKAGDTVIDLGSGAGNDCFVARALVGDKGNVIGVDITQAMIDKARDNVRKLEYTNVKFRLGDIEKLPVTAEKADVVISNCVLNLVPDKVKAFSEIFRVLKKGGHFSVSDVVVRGELPKALLQAAEMYAGCVTGAIPLEEYLQIISGCGFSDINVQKIKPVTLPDEILLNYLSPDELSDFRTTETGVYSITVTAMKPVSRCGCGCNCN